ncbi:helix-turn-helix domain-containing protein [Hoeflea prorocentri]|uniref:AraC family transcriptional regulator n=1 Tax=Hoeflea prorocentri TaxID=1922333 RepID=A0A9X3ZGD2_9HYPH|nr:AraC family transcriptional regulator [Hoeflea prorocentri]MCY6379620.1 AraC family transcriptional regulator [Hoeflea prorocentri]MDA5397420.1 AraC family transcriptional regulator [Hoeflea prorocentri]
MIDIGEIKRIETGQINYAPGRSLGPRIQTGLQLVMLDHGSVSIDTDGTKITLHPGQVCCQWPGFRETYVFDKHQASSHRWIAISPEGDHATSKMLDLRGILPKFASETPLMRGLFEAVRNGPGIHMEETPQLISDRSWPDVQMLLVKAYLTAFADQWSEDKTGQEIYNRPRPLARLARFIEQNYARQISLTDMAGAAKVTESYLVRLCRTHGKPTPAQWLWNERVTRGHGLLRNTGLNVSEVAERVGFANPYHFSRLFKDRTGMTPTQARREAWHSTEGISPNAGERQ